MAPTALGKDKIKTCQPKRKLLGSGPAFKKPARLRLTGKRQEKTLTNRVRIEKHKNLSGVLADVC